MESNVAHIGCDGASVRVFNIVSSWITMKCFSMHYIQSCVQDLSISDCVHFSARILIANTVSIIRAISSWTIMQASFHALFATFIWHFYWINCQHLNTWSLCNQTKLTNYKIHLLCQICCRGDEIVVWITLTGNICCNRVSRHWRPEFGFCMLPVVRFKQLKHLVMVRERLRYWLFQHLKATISH